MKTLCCCVMLLCLSALIGCGKPYVAEFEPNMVFAHHVSLIAGEPMDQALAETQTALTRLFGTPDDPTLPEFIQEDDELSTLVSMDNLLAASGSPAEAGRGLYRQHCSTCHGVTGNGRGTTAALLDPYPRDYRLGKFKFKSTSRGAKPLREDLAYLIRHGIQGTTMKEIPELNENPADIEALVDYVIYLSWRGEVERSILAEAEYVVFDEGETLYNEQWVETYLPWVREDVDPESIADEAVREEYEEFIDQWELITDVTIGVAESWLDAEDAVVEIPDPQDVVVPDSIEEVVAAVESEEDSPVKQSVQRGQMLFVSEQSACAKCHGKEGRGDGGNIDYDDWAKDWTLLRGIKPDDEAAQVPLIARGVLPPRIIVPRDFREGLFRGGAEPDRLYHRISQGIDGTPMPAAPLSPAQIWDLVNFVRSLREPLPMTTPATAEPSGEAAPAAQPTESAAVIKSIRGLN